MPPALADPRQALQKLVGEFSAILWTHLTFNSWSGCCRISKGCENCYADDLPGERKRGAEWGPSTPRMRASPTYLRQPYRWDRVAEAAGVRLRVFCSSTADVMEDRADLDPWRANLWEIIRGTPNLDWLVLTKRPGRMLRWAREEGWPENAIPGATVECQEVAEPRIRDLLQVQARLRFLSLEPLLGGIDFSRMTTDPLNSGFAMLDGFGRFDGEPPAGISWVIAGGESGPRARPSHPDWFRSVRDQTARAGIPFLFKQWGEWGPPDGETPFSTSDGMAGKPPAFLVDLDGDTSCFYRAGGKKPLPMVRYGKHRTGRMLDGVAHEAFPPGMVPRLLLAS